MTTVNLQPYNPGMAETGKFARVNSDYLQSTFGYPSSAEGRYAMFTYNLNPDVTILSGATLNVSVCDVAIDNWNDLIAETYTDQALSANVSITNFNEATSVFVTNLNEISAIKVTNLDEISAIKVTNLDEISALSIINLSEISAIKVTNLDEISAVEVTNLNELSTIKLTVNSIDFVDVNKDAFNRLRVSEPYTLFSSKMTIDKNTEYWDEVLNGSSSSVHVSADAAITLSVSISGDYAIRQTKQRFTYQAGKSQYSLLTFSNFEIQPDITKKVGLFYSELIHPYDNTLDGIYLESNGISNTYNFCIGKSTGSNNGTQTVAQSAWNVDKMDGFGPSKITLDFSKNQILYIDYEWLGVGTVRLGFVVNGKFYIAHQFYHTNITQGVYMTSPNLPVRYEIRSYGSSGVFKQICSSIMSEGGYNPTSTVHTISRSIGIGPFTNVNIASGDVVPLISLRLKPNGANSTVNLINYNIVSTGAMDGVYQLLLLRDSFHSVDDGSWTALQNIGIEYKNNSTIASRITSEGIVINSSYFTSTNQSASMQTDIINDVVPIGMSIKGISDRIDLAIKKLIPDNKNVNLFASLTFKEIR